MQVHSLTHLPTNWADPVLTLSQAQELLAQPHHTLLALGPADAPHGYLLARLVPYTPADILTLYVAPSHRRSGLALALMQQLLTTARNASCTGLTLEVESTNEAALRLYKVCGLQQIGKRGGYYRDAVSNLKADALVLALTWS